MIICRNKDGFTLVEILVVVALIAILATMVVGVASHIDTQAKEKALEGTFVLLDSALQEYRQFTDKFPEHPQGVPGSGSDLLYRELHSVPDSRSILDKIDQSLIQNTGGGAGTQVLIYDPWGKPLDYSYSRGENFPVMTSAGPDKVFGTADDMSSK